MIRVTKVAKDNAVKARSSAMISLKQVVVNAPDELRQSLQGPTEDDPDPPVRRAATRPP